MATCREGVSADRRGGVADAAASIIGDRPDAEPSPPRTRPGCALARLRIQATYLFRHRRLAALDQPRLFTELIQHRKLADRDPRLPLLADKLLAKTHVAATLGPEWVTPTLWAGTDLPPLPSWPVPFVVKSRHGCNHHAFVRAMNTDWAALRRRAQRWMARPYGAWLDEWAYAQIERGLLIEPFIGEDGVLPIDYKLFVFGGRVAFIQVHLARETAHRWLLFDRHWRRLARGQDAPPPPRSLATMIAGAERLGRDFAFVRVDCYDIFGRARFGEMTFYPGSGLLPIDPPELDGAMGKLWRDAAAGQDQSPLAEPVPGSDIAPAGGSISAFPGGCPR